MHHNQLIADDAKIENHNKRLRAAFDVLEKSKLKVAQCKTGLTNLKTSNIPEYRKLVKNLAKAEKQANTSQVKYDKEIKNGQALGHIGSGKATVMLQ